MDEHRRHKRPLKYNYLQLFNSVFFVYISLCVSSASGSDGDVYPDQPRIVSQDGHLLFVAAESRNITFRSKGNGKIRVNDEDLGAILLSAKRSVAELELIKTDELVVMRQNIQQIQTQLSRLAELGGRMSDVENSIRQQARSRLNATQLTAVQNRINQMNRRMNHMKTRLDSMVNLLARDECSSNPCQNGGRCQDSYNSFLCNCPSNWEGPTCSADVNECARYSGTTMGCQNGATCVNTYGGFSCQCPAGWFGVHCTERRDDCSSSSNEALCGHGTCISQHSAVAGQPGYTCICNEGWTTGNGGRACNVDINECSTSRRPPCSTNPAVQCVNLPGTFTCAPCPNGYSGNGFVCDDVNECAFNNGGCSTTPMVQCINTPGSRQCGACPTGYQGNGETCFYVGICRLDNGGCHPLANCIENPGISTTYRECRCPSGYQGSGVGPAGCIYQSGGGSSITPVGDPCSANPCVRGTCTAIGTSNYHCNCPLGYSGQRCELDVNECLSQPCQNGGTCVDQTNGFHCNCPQTHTGSRCELIRDECGGRLDGDNGTLVYPSGQLTQYLHNRSCAWLITTPQHLKILNLTFVRFSLESSPDCQFDFLQVNDGTSAAAHPLGRFCGSNRPSSILTTHNSAYVWFYSDSTVATEGFTIRWNTVEAVCGGQSDEVKDYGTIKSPGYPGRYPINRDCVWIVRVPPGKRIQFAFATMQLEHHDNCNYDFLEVRDGASERDHVLATYCSTVNPAPLQTSGSTARLFFHSDHSHNDVGFLITYNSLPGIPGCGGLLSGERGSLSSPDHPNRYEHGLECDWLIRVHPNERIRLTFTAMDIEFSRNNCQWDYVQVFDGADDTATTYGRKCGRNLPPQVVSTGNTLFVKFKTDSSISMPGFRAVYELICGGVFTSENGVIHSPYYPDPYPRSRECQFLISVRPGKVINLWFEAFDVEGPSTSCRYDYLQIRDGDSGSSPLLGTLCGPDTPPPLISTYNVMWMKFRTDASVQNRGFLANYTTIDVGCGGIYHNESSGVITSPNHPEEYLHNVSCKWIIRPPAGHLVRLTFNSFALESHWQCSYDYLAIYDNVTTEDPQRLIGKYCGSEIPPILTSTDNLLYIVFRSDISVSSDGFSFTFANLDASTSCGGNYFTSVGVLRSPNYPANYRHGVSCVWTIVAPEGRQIRLNATSFRLEEHANCNFDYLEIRNGGDRLSPSIGRFCGANIPSIITSHSNRMWLQFASDGSNSAPGFEISWDSALTGCGGELTGSEGALTSPNYPSGCSPGVTCHWSITVNRGNRIRMVITDLDTATTRNCTTGVKIFSGRSNRGHLLAAHCGTHIPDPISSESNEAFIEFQCPYSFSTQRGFRLNYNIDCRNIVLGGHRGVIETPNFPQPYPHNRNCSWTIDKALGSTIDVSFTMLRLEHANDCRYDYVQLNNLANRTTIGRYCSAATAPLATIATNTNRLNVQFVSDYSYAENGFSLEWVANGCGGELRKASGGFATPNYPSHYPPGIMCEWDIAVSMGHGIELTIHEYDIESGGSNCNFDSIKIYSGSDNRGILLNTICERRTSPVIVTTSANRMYIRFVSDYSRSGRGFNASYVTRPQGCGGVSTASHGVIHSRNYPQSYPAQEDCTWLIKVSEGHRVDVQLIDVDIPFAVNCSNGYLAIYDGENETSSDQLLKKCDNRAANVTSSGNQVVVRLRGDGEQRGGRGFSLSYATVCGAILSAGATEGEISTYDSSVATYRNCSWVIRAERPEDRVSLTFTSLDAPSEVTWGCRQNYVAVYEGEGVGDEANGSQPLRRLCDNRLPPTITSRGNSLRLAVVSTWHINVIKFRAIYHQTSNVCGGTLEATSGSFTSPDYPDSYPLNIECVWILKASVGNKLSLSFSSFQVEQSDYCNGDYVEIRENDGAGALIGRICGSDSDSVNLANMTAANQLWLKFRSDGEGTEAGFVANFNIVPNVELRGSSGLVSSPNYPRLLRNAGPMSWTITVPDDKLVEVSFVRMELHSNFAFRNQRRPVRFRSCLSQLQVFDGAGTDGTLLGTYCDANLPDPVISTANTLTLTFNNRRDLIGSAFLLTWNATVPRGGSENVIPGETPWVTTSNVAGCGGVIFLNESDWRVVTSPGYPLGYADNIRCEWLVSSAETTHLNLQWLAVDLENNFGCHADYVQLWTARSALTTSAPEWQEVGKYCRHGDLSQLPTSLPTNSMRLRFKTDYAVNSTGFAINVVAACGGNVSGPSGVLRSPLYPSNYPPNQQCNWAIAVRPGRTISIQMEEFELQGDPPTCRSDFLLLRNGFSAQSPILGSGKYCGSTLPRSIPQTTSNHLYVQFVSDSLYAYKGFRLRYSEVSQECGGVLLLDEGEQVVLSSPNYPSAYPVQTHCEWRIIGPIRMRVKVDFQQPFDIPLEASCSNDYVAIYDGGTDNSAQIGRLCGHDVPHSALTTANVAFVVFHSEDLHPSIGFKATVTIGECGGLVVSEMGTLSSPNYPHGYRANADCEWTLRGPRGHFYVLNFIDLQTSTTNNDCGQSDSVVIRDFNSTGPLLGQFCGQSASAAIQSADNQVYIRFRSLSASSLPGFLLHFNVSSEECGGELSSPTGVIVSPNYPRAFPRHRRCQWTIRAAEGRKVRLRFTHFDLNGEGDNCVGAVVMVKNSPYRDYSTLPPYQMCGTAIPPVLNSSSNYMKLIFYSYSDVTGTGFRAVYDTDMEWDCGGELAPESGSFASPGYNGGSYSHNLVCEWTINNPNSSAAYVIRVNHMSLEMNSECLFDLLEMRGGLDRTGPALATLCGNHSQPVTYVLPYPQLYFLFQSDQSINQHGFNITYQAIECGGELGETGGVIQSPSYPSNYANDVHCAWAIELAEGQQALMTFDDMALELSDNCSRDYILIRNGYKLDAPVINRFCGSNRPHDVITQRHRAIVEFHTDQHNTAKGFKIIVAALATGCSGVYHEAEGQLKSVNYPSDYPSSTECDWLLEGETGFFYNVTFVERFDVERSVNCSNDFVEGFDYVNGDWASLGRQCGPVLPQPYLTTSHRFRLLFRSNDAVTGDGFKANWTQICGGKFDGSSEGSFHSPGYPVAYRNNLNCQYLITPPEGHYVVITFDDNFLLEDDNRCKFDALTVYGGNTTGHPQLRRSCGATPPATVSSLGPLLVHFKTDVSVVKRGFRATYTTSACGGVLRGSSGEIRSPTMPDRYHSNTRCSWLIEGAPGKVVEIKFQMLDLEGWRSQCYFDHVSIYNGNVSSANQMARVCGNTTLPIVKSTTHNVTVVFTTDGSVERTGFTLLYRLTYGPSHGCGGALNASSGTIESLDVDRDGQYEGGLVCDWSVAVAPLQSIQLTFTRFDIERPTDRTVCPWDYLELRDGMLPTAPLIGRFCGAQPPPTITTSGPQLFVRFVSDEVQNAAGFTLNYQAIDPPCGGIINGSGVIASPNYPSDYPINQRCRWLLLQPSDLQYRYIKFDSFELESSANCQKDFLSIADMYMGPRDPAEPHVIESAHYDGDFRRHCGSTPPPNRLISSSVSLIFSSDATATAKGFHIQVTQPPCNESVTSPFGVYDHVLMVREDASSMTCVTTITTAVGSTITLAFMRLQVVDTPACQRGYVEVRDGANETAPRLFKLCGYQNPNPVFSTGNSLWIKSYYLRNADLDRYMLNGVYATALFSSTAAGRGCGGQLPYDYGYVYSPDYPLNHPVDDVCQWEISVPHNKRVSAQFQQFDVGPADNCTANYVQLFRGTAQDEDQLIATLCPGDNAGRYESPTNLMLVKYVTSVNNIGTGFKLYFFGQNLIDASLLEPGVDQLERQPNTGE